MTSHLVAALILFVALLCGLVSERRDHDRVGSVVGWVGLALALVGLALIVGSILTA